MRRNIHLYKISRSPISASISVLHHRRLQVHRQDRRPDPNRRPIFHPIPNSSGRIALPLHSKRPFDPISLFLLSLEPAILLSRRPSQRPQRHPNPVALKRLSCLPRAMLVLILSFDCLNVIDFSVYLRSLKIG
jgi:hypothetical protein